MKARIGISILFLPIIFFVTYSNWQHSFLFFLFILIVSILSTRELYSLLKNGFGKGLYFPPSFLFYVLSGIIIIVFYAWWLFYKNFINPWFITLFVLVILTAWIVIRGRKAVLRILLISAGSIVYTGLIPALLVAIRLTIKGRGIVFLLFFLTWINDAAAYFLGSFFGKHKGIIRYSPNKSLEGYTGSFFVIIGAAFFIAAISRGSFPFKWYILLALAIATSFFGHGGDIVESIVKRKAGEKDSSRLLPGLGGVLDVFDSIYAVVPAYYLFVQIAY